MDQPALLSDNAWHAKEARLAERVQGHRPDAFGRTVPFVNSLDPFSNRRLIQFFAWPDHARLSSGDANAAHAVLSPSRDRDQLCIEMNEIQTRQPAQSRAAVTEAFQGSRATTFTENSPPTGLLAERSRETRTWVEVRGLVAAADVTARLCLAIIPDATKVTTSVRVDPEDGSQNLVLRVHTFATPLAVIAAEDTLHRKLLSQLRIEAVSQLVIRYDFASE